jgi:serine/threonine protein phosphatase PrpC
MTRAFGNFGHKEWRGRTAIESLSPIIARPHVSTHERTGKERYLVIGSDGLWDNLDASEVTDILRQEAAAVAAAEAAAAVAVAGCVDADDGTTPAAAAVAAAAATADAGASAAVAGDTNEAAAVQPQQPQPPHNEEQRWRAMAQRSAVAMLKKALRIRKKPDDITCVVLVFL